MQVISRSWSEYEFLVAVWIFLINLWWGISAFHWPVLSASMILWKCFNQKIVAVVCMYFTFQTYFVWFSNRHFKNYSPSFLCFYVTKDQLVSTIGIIHRKEGTYLYRLYIIFFVDEWPNISHIGSLWHEKEYFKSH